MRALSLSLSFSLVFFSLRPIAFSSSLHANFISLRCGHYIAIIKLCRKPAVVILAVYCAQRSHVQEETIIFDRVHCVQCITQSRPGRTAESAHSLTPAYARNAAGGGWWSPAICCQESFASINYTRLYSHLSATKDVAKISSSQRSMRVIK